MPKWQHIAVAMLLGGLAFLAFRLGTWWLSQRQWFDIQSQQLETIESLGQFPPEGKEPTDWKSALVTPYNVWGNVTFHPDHSKLSNADMRLLQERLTKIAAETTTENSFESVDQIFEMMLEFCRDKEFVNRYRESFRGYQ